MTTTIDRRQLVWRRWALEPERSEIGFRVPHFWGLMTVTGTFGDVRGSLDLTDPEHPAAELVIDASSVDTGHAGRNKHLRSEAFFAADQGAELRFASDSVALTPDGSEMVVAGELRIRGQRMPLELTATLERLGGELRVQASVKLDHRELGMTYSPLGMIRTPSTIYINALLRAEVQS
jgi:polyisoprenoid-binding protein YceI